MHWLVCWLNAHSLFEKLLLYPLPEHKCIGETQKGNTHIGKLNSTRVTEGGGWKGDKNGDLNYYCKILPESSNITRTATGVLCTFRNSMTNLILGHSLLRLWHKSRKMTAKYICALSETHSSGFFYPLEHIHATADQGQLYILLCF